MNNVTATINSTSAPWKTQPISTTTIYTSRDTEEFSSNLTNSTANTIETTENLNTFMVGLLLQFAVILVFFGNALVLVALKCYRNWTSADVLLFSLSSADLLDSIVALELITVVKYFLGRQMSKSMCDSFVGLVYTFRLVSATTVTVIAVERSILLVYPLRHHTHVTPSRIKKFVAGIWIFSIFSAILPFIGVGHSGFKNGVCFSQIYDLGTAYAIFIEVYGAIMLLAVFASYFAIKLSGKMFIRRQTLMTGHGGMREGAQSVKNRRESVQIPGNTSGVRSVRKLSVMMGIVVIIYYISWLPFLVSEYQILKYRGPGGYASETFWEGGQSVKVSWLARLTSDLKVSRSSLVSAVVLFP